METGRMTKCYVCERKGNFKKYGVSGIGKIPICPGCVDDLRFAEDDL